MNERSLVLLKPDAVQRAITGQIISRFERAGLKIVAMKMVWIDKKFASIHYPEHLIPIVGKKTLADWDDMGIKTKKTAEELGVEIMEDLMNFTTEAPILAMVLEGIHAVSQIRKMVGHTSPHKAKPGTIRGDFTTISMGFATQRRFGGRNLVHASGTIEEAKKEIDLWFKSEEVHDYKTVHEPHVR